MQCSQLRDTIYYGKRIEYKINSKLFDFSDKHVKFKEVSNYMEKQILYEKLLTEKTTLEEYKKLKYNFRAVRVYRFVSAVFVLSKRHHIFKL